MRKIWLMLACVAGLLGTTSCEKDNGPVVLPEDMDGMYILNNGSYQGNNSSLTFYNPVTKVATQGVFQARNGKKLGDTAQDIIIYGGKMYITVYNSGIIFVTDKKGSILKEIKLTDYTMPRCLTSYQGKVYATYFDGGLAQIDTTTFSTKTVKVGDNPEELRAVNGKVYVANSGGMGITYGNTVSVVDIASWKVNKTLDVVMNPCSMEMYNGEVYLISLGDYNMTQDPVLQKIDPQTDKVSRLSLSCTNRKGENVQVNPNFMAIGANGNMYLMASLYENYNLISNDFYVFNIPSGVVEEFVTDTKVEKPFSLSASPVSGNVYIGSSDYVNTGDLYVFGMDGKLKDKFETGISPIQVCLLTNPE